MTKKIENTFNRTMDQIEKYSKVYREGGKLEQAVAQDGGDIAWFKDIRDALEDLMHALEEGAMSHNVATNESVTESKQINEGVLDADDDDGFMARSQLYFMARDAIQLHGIIGDTDDLEPWVQSKIAQAAQGMDAVRRYTEYNAMKQEMPMDSAMDMEEDEDLDEAVGKLGKYALAAMLGLGAVKGIDATSAKHSPLGQALDHAASTWSGEEAAQALELYKNIDLYADEGHGPLRHWASQNQDLINQFKESTVSEGSYGKKKKKKYYDESYQDRYNRAKATANDIKVNRELATMPQDAARKVSGDADYSHDSNPAYAAKKAARKDGIPHKDIVTRMKPNPTDGKFKWGRDQLSDDVNENSLEDKLMNDAKEMDMEDFVAHAMKHGMKKSDAYGMWDDMNPYDEDHIEPFSDDDYDEFGVRHSTSFNMPPKNESAEEKPYICVHAKKGKHECHASSSYEAAKKAASHWKMKSTAGIDAHLAVEETVNEGMEFDEKRNDDLQTVAKDLFANAKAAAKKKVK